MAGTERLKKVLVVLSLTGLGLAGSHFFIPPNQPTSGESAPAPVAQASRAEHMQRGSAQPNVLLIVADDLGINDIGVDDVTPNIDALARGGMTFSRHYTDSTCSPSRAALLSGLYPARLGYLPSGLGISAEIPTIPRSLQAAGYTTWHLGKWHIGSTVEQAWPLQQGFDESLSFLTQWQLAGLTDPQSRLPQPGPPRYLNPWLRENNDPPREFKGHLTDLLTAQAIEKIENHQGSPWFLNLWYYAPHSPVQPTTTYLEPAGKFSEAQRNYRALVRQLDANIGRLIAALSTLGALDNTLIIFLSDNGGSNRAQDSNYPLVGKKASYTEGGVRAPLILHWPGQIPAGEERSDVVSLLDIYPTILDVVNSETTPTLDGQSLWPVVRRENPPERYLFWESYRARRAEYSVLSADGHWRLQTGATGWLPSSKPVLYDLEGDPTGATAKVVPERSAELRSQHSRWHRQVHRVPVSIQPLDALGKARLTGHDMQRSPGSGMYTFAIGLQATAPGAGLSTLVQQQDLWRLDYDWQTRTLKLKLLDLDISGPLTLGNSCQSIVVSVQVKHKLNNWKYGPPRSTVKLYAGEELLAEAKVDRALDNPHALANPTWVGTDIAETQGFPGLLSTPLVLNVITEPGHDYSPASIHEELCPVAPR